MTKVLLVDDNINRIKKFQEKILSIRESSFIDLVICHTADKARELCKTTRYDILILDVLLPKKIGMKANKEVGINLLNDLNRRKQFSFPNNIIGITANINDITEFREKFLEHAVTVLEAPINQTIWIEKIKDIILNTMETYLAEEQKNDKIVISLHGIRTLGTWQNIFSDFINEKTKGIEHHSFKYGFFGLLFFIFPIIRIFHSKKFIKKIENIINKNSDKEIYIFAHSYGTYIISKLLEKNSKIRINTLFLSGSVLPSNYDIYKKFEDRVDKIINDCGINDFVLVINKLLVPFLGDAERIGFSGVNNKQIINRFFQGGHSLYFKNYKNKNFMEYYWIPYLIDSKELSIIDERKDTLLLDFIEPLLTFLSMIKDLAFISLIFYLLYSYVI
jgi:CheY-like chemotaxis protein